MKKDGTIKVVDERTYKDAVDMVITVFVTPNRANNERPWELRKRAEVYARSFAERTCGPETHFQLRPCFEPVKHKRDNSRTYFFNIVY